MSASNRPGKGGPLSPEALKVVAQEVAGIELTDEELKLCANRLDGLLSAVRELERLDLGELEPLYTILMPEES
jgi:Asp-tRNA(Asn)/Glu-tRNA(Gln) amidotransferase C subunit